MTAPNAENRSESHNFLVIAVEPAEAQDGRIAVTLTDVRGGRVTLHLDPANARSLRDALDHRS